MVTLLSHHIKKGREEFFEFLLRILGVLRDETNALVSSQRERGIRY